MRVERADGTWLALRDARLERDTLWGRAPATGAAVAVPRDSVRRVDRRAVSPGRTTVLLSGIVVVALAAAATIALLADGIVLMP